MLVLDKSLNHLMELEISETTIDHLLVAYRKEKLRFLSKPNTKDAKKDDEGDEEDETTQLYKKWRRKEGKTRVWYVGGAEH